MFSEIMIMLCVIASMIELFMLDLVMFIIYLFWNLIMLLSNTSTVCWVRVRDFGILVVEPSAWPSLEGGC